MIIIDNFYFLNGKNYNYLIKLISLLQIQINSNSSFMVRLCWNETMKNNYAHKMYHCLDCEVNH